VYRKAIDILRSRKHQVVEEVKLEETVFAEEIDDDARERNELIAESAKSLPPQYSAALWLYEREGKSEREIGDILMTSQDSAQKLVMRGRQQLGRRYIELAGAMPGEPEACQARTERLWDMLTGEIPPEERLEHEAHAHNCQFCRPKLERLRVAAAYGLVLPLAVSELLRRRDEVIRLVMTRPVAAHTPILQRWALPATAVLLLIIGAATAPALIQLPSPTRGPAAQLTPSAAIPAIPLGGFAYLHNRELAYSAKIGAEPVQLTSTGGRVDDFAWTADGRALVYKVKNSDSTLLGELHQVDLANRTIGKWTLPGAACFSLSPDGTSYVAGVPVHNADGTWSYRLLIGATGQAPDPAREIDLKTGVDDKLIVGYLSEVPDYVRSLPGGGAPMLFWTNAGIFFDPFGPGQYQIDPTTKAVSPWNMTNYGDPLIAYRGPADSPFSLQFGRAVVINSSGQTILRSIPGQVLEFLSVSPDGTRALVTTFPTGGNGYDMSAVALDGSITAISSDGASAKGLWQPQVGK
jgi:hypothetical protein